MEAYSSPIASQHSPIASQDAPAVTQQSQDGLVGSEEEQEAYVSQRSGSSMDDFGASNVARSHVNGQGLWRSWQRSFRSPLDAMLDLVGEILGTTNAV